MSRALDRPVSGWILSEEIIRENLDTGRADHVRSIFDRRITRRTGSPFRTRVIIGHVLLSLHDDCKRSHIKQ